MGQRQLRRPRQPGRPGLLRLDDAPLRELGTGFSEGRLRRGSPLQGRRDSHDRHRDREGGAADCAESLAGSDGPESCRRSGGILANVAYRRRHLGWLGFPRRAVSQRDPLGFRQPGEMGEIRQARQLAGRGHAAVGVADAPPGLGTAATVAHHPGRTANSVRALGDLAVASDPGRQPHQAGRLHSLADHQQGSNRHRPDGGFQRRDRRRSRGFRAHARLVGRNRRSAADALCGGLQPAGIRTPKRCGVAILLGWERSCSLRNLEPAKRPQRHGPARGAAAPRLRPFPD